MVKITHAMVLAAGRGERLRPITDTLPKPLVSVGGRTMLDRQLDRMAEAGVSEAVVNSSWLADVLEAHLAQREGAPHITISREEERLETGGGILKALPLLGSQPFFSSNADVVLVDVAAQQGAAQRMMNAWDGDAMDVLMLLHPLEKAVGYEGAGDFFLEANGMVKRRGDASRAPYVFTGMQIIHPRLFDGVGEQGAFSMNVLYNKGKTPEGVLPRVYGIVHAGDWLHVGDAEGLHLAEKYFA
jgi:MurNAc alpha-1-phosphate uridylyltransferase